MAGRPGNEGTNKTPIRACFLVYLLQATNVPYQGVRITNVVIDGPLDVANMVVGAAASLRGCEFNNDVDFSSAHFREGLSLAESRFDGEAVFEDAWIEGDLELTRAVFVTNAEFNHMHIGADLDGRGAWFGGEAMFTGLEVGHSVKFDSDSSTKFTVTTNALRQSELFHESNNDISTSVEVIHPEHPTGQSRLLDTLNHRAYSLWITDQKDANNIPTNEYIVVKRATYFSADMDTSGSRVAKKFTATDAYFAGDAHFDSLKVNDSMDASCSDFNGAVSWGFADVASQFSAKSAWFESQNNVNCYCLRCAECVLEGADFEGGLNFQNVNVSGDVRAAGCMFGSNLASDFLASNVKGTCNFTGSKFQGPVRFLLAQIGGNFVVKDAEFDDTTSLDGLTNKTNDRLTFTANADFAAMNVNGFAIFDRARFEKNVSFRYAHFQNLFLNDVAWQTNCLIVSNLVRFDGMSYGVIQASTDATNDTSQTEDKGFEDTWAQMHRVLVNRSSYTRGTYKDLEAYFTRQGRSDLADEAFLEGKRQERKTETHWTAWIFDWFLYLTVGYGRKPLLAIFWSVLIVLFGAFLFRFRSPLKAIEQKKGAAHSRLNFVDCLWYSLDLFLPVVDLKTSDRFELEPDHWLIECYAYGCRIVGFLLIPIWAAALGGLLD